MHVFFIYLHVSSFGSRARISKPFKEPKESITSLACRYDNPIWRTGPPCRLHRPAESIPWNRFLGFFNVYKFGLCWILDLTSRWHNNRSKCRNKVWFGFQRVRHHGEYRLHLWLHCRGQWGSCLNVSNLCQFLSLAFYGCHQGHMYSTCILYKNQLSWVCRLTRF